MVAGLAREGHQQLVRSAEIPRSVIPCGEGPSPCITAQGAGQGQCPGEHDGTMVRRASCRYAGASAERVAIARIEALLDRYGVIAPPMIDKERLDGGFSGL